MRTVILTMTLVAASLVFAGPTLAAPAAAPATHTAPPHRMSALAASSQRQDGDNGDLRLVSGAGARATRWSSSMRFGPFGRSYRLDAQHPAIRPDQDGAVGFSFSFKRRP